MSFLRLHRVEAVRGPGRTFWSESQRSTPEGTTSPVGPPRLDFARSPRLVRVIVLFACQGDARSHFPPRADLEEMARLFVEDGEAEHVFLSTLDADGSSDIVAFPGPPLAGLHLGSSIERVFLGTLLADMISRGEIALDSPASDYLPEEIELPTFGDRHITILDLVTHRSGLSDSQFEAACTSARAWSNPNGRVRIRQSAAPFCQRRTVDQNHSRRGARIRTCARPLSQTQVHG